MPAVSISSTRSPSMSAVSVTRSRVVPGTRRHNRASGAKQRVEQAGFAHVRLAGNRHLRAFADQPAPLRIAEQRAHLAVDVAERRGRLTGRHEVIALVWKIERRFDARDQIEQLAIDLADPLP